MESATSILVMMITKATKDLRILCIIMFSSPLNENPMGSSSNFTAVGGGKYHVILCGGVLLPSIDGVYFNPTNFDYILFSSSQLFDCISHLDYLLPSDESYFNKVYLLY